MPKFTWKLQSYTCSQFYSDRRISFRPTVAREPRSRADNPASWLANANSTTNVRNEAFADAPNGNLLTRTKDGALTRTFGYPAGTAAPAHADAAERGGGRLRRQRQHGERRELRREVRVRGEGRMAFDTLVLRPHSALDGLGLAYLPEDQVPAHVAAGRLVRVLEDWYPFLPGHHLYYPNRLTSSPTLALLVETLRHRGP